MVPAGLRVACSRLAERFGSSVDARAESIFRALVYGWVFHRLVEVVYESRTRGEPHRLELRRHIAGELKEAARLYP